MTAAPEKPAMMQIALSTIVPFGYRALHHAGHGGYW